MRYFNIDMNDERETFLQVRDKKLYVPSYQFQFNFNINHMELDTHFLALLKISSESYKSKVYYKGNMEYMHVTPAEGCIVTGVHLRSKISFFGKAQKGMTYLMECVKTTTYYVDINHVIYNVSNQNIVFAPDWMTKENEVRIQRHRPNK